MIENILNEYGVFLNSYGCFVTLMCETHKIKFLFVSNY